MIERLRLYVSKNPLISITHSAEPPVRCDFDAALLPASLFLDPVFPKTATIHRLHAAGCSLICFGAAELLPGCFLAGCDEYLKEPWHPAELEWRVRILRGNKETLFFFSWGSFEIGNLEIRSSRGSCRLCVQEQGILRLLAANAGRPVSREALFYGIWGRPSDGGSRAVDMHIASLRKKLRSLFPESGVFIRSVRGVGYLIVS